MKSQQTDGENRDVFTKLKEKYRQLSKSHKKIALYIMKNYEKVPHMSAIQVAKAVGVSEATVVRFAISMGYAGYPEFRKAMRDEVNSKLTTVERIDMTIGDDEKAVMMKSAARQLMKNDIQAIKDTMKIFDDEHFEESVNLIVGAKRVYIIGFRTTSLLTEYLGYYLGLILDDVRIVNQNGADFYEHLIKVNPDDVVLALSFPRYAQKTMEALEYLKDKGSKIIVISDNVNAPINRYADISLFAKSNVYSFVDSLVAPLSLIDALAAAAGFKNIGKTKKTFNQLEAIWEKNTVYTGDKLEGELWGE
jgi:DNA-binding MurR/RpiR family transcriptional regulator